MDKTKLRRKILGAYGSLGAFCEAIGYSRTQLSNVLTNRHPGGMTMWKAIQEKLNLTNEELTEYIFEGGEDGQHSKNK